MRGQSALRAAFRLERTSNLCEHHAKGREKHRRAEHESRVRGEEFNGKFHKSPPVKRCAIRVYRRPHEMRIRACDFAPRASRQAFSDAAQRIARL